MSKSKWDIYLTKEAKHYYYEKNQETPRQWEILYIIMENKGLKDLPFKAMEEDVKYYNSNKEYYEIIKQANGGEEVYFKFAAE